MQVWSVCTCGGMNSRWKLKPIINRNGIFLACISVLAGQCAVILKLMCLSENDEPSHMIPRQ